MKISRFTKAVVLINGAVPVILLSWDALTGSLGANPVNFAIRTTGMLSLIFLAISLTITPVSRLAHWGSLGQFRRPAGLYAFFHTAIHFVIFFLFDRSGKIGDTVSEIILRPYLMVGFLGLLIMVPLAVTSADAMIRRMGPARWKLLHRLAYVVAIAGGGHFYMLVKSDTTRPLIYAAVILVLFAYRLVAWQVGRIRSAAKASAQWSGQLRIAKITQETPDVRTFRLVLPGAMKLPFEHSAGQYLNLTVEIDGRPVKRSYTIASPGTRSDYCEISVKREANGLVSRHLHDTLREGDVLQVSAPAGRFTFAGTEANNIVLIAGGVGITPLMAKIRQLTDQNWNGSIHLIFSVKSEEDIVFRSELDELKKKFPNLRVTVTITRDAAKSWTGERGRINAEMLARVAPELTKSRVHLCGPTEMTSPLIAILRDMGVPNEMIKFESFASPSRGQVTKSARQELKPSESATLEFVISGKQASNLKGRTVLEIAEDQGVEIPYDCRSGICGQCKVQLLSGNVVMDSEDALDATESANRIILACQARCVDNVQIDA